MPKLKVLHSLFLSAPKRTTSATASTTATKTTATATKSSTSRTDETLTQYLSSIDSSSLSSFLSSSISKHSKQSLKPPPPPPPLSNSKKPPPSSTLHNLPDSDSDSEDASSYVAKHISSLLQDGDSVTSPSFQGNNSKNSLESVLSIPWCQQVSHQNVTQQRKDLSRTRKKTYVFKSTQKIRFNKLFKRMDQKLGPDVIIDLCNRLGRETGAKEYNAVMKLSIERATASKDKDSASKQISVALELFKLMKEEGFHQDEETYSPFLMYFIDMGMVEEFEIFCEAIEDNDPKSLARLGYYEMLLYVGVNNEVKIQEICSYIANGNANENFDLRENYLLALCERDRKNELLQLLEVIDITQVSSLDHMVNIFNSLGRLSLESLAKKFLLAFKECEYGAENISTLIFHYASSIPNLVVDNVILKFKSMHLMLEMSPSSKSYEKLIRYSCDLLKVHAALEIVNEMCKDSLTLSIDTLNSLLRACDESFEFNLVQGIYSLISFHNMTPNTETFRSMISLRVKMKDYHGAYEMLDDLEKYGLIPTTSMYNAIMAGYFREKNVSGGLTVLKKMELANINPDTQTYSFLITNCNSEDQISKYFKELESSRIPKVKQIYMALVNAYANCGQFEKAKQVLSDKEIPSKDVNEIKSVLVAALASHGQMSDALLVYEEIKEGGGTVEPKSVISLIEYCQSECEPSTLLKLLGELKEPDYWVDGCCRVILCFIRYNNLRFFL
ncbi:pentatricopeptide repeat-containing protein At4g04790, mitochondrial-like isoform X2 [Mercurialis annua]|uniref:pentatricopeptide repeat-containing protein At4g04790, mitochondrial-like isoform X2 n=1 Tax=Mercurialis annua TaxID=3986 RepID=UPI00216103E7|nr:pentatricopeptide repeat-containing protein At4g04790, mitochondrial-like isoform X2 [Mercurialis annua]